MGKDCRGLCRRDKLSSVPKADRATASAKALAVAAYLSIDEVDRVALQYARRSTSYGLLSENPDFVDACVITTSNSSARAPKRTQLGDKTSARRSLLNGRAGYPHSPKYLAMTWRPLRGGCGRWLSADAPRRHGAVAGGEMRHYMDESELEEKFLRVAVRPETRTGNSESCPKNDVKARHVEVPDPWRQSRCDLSPVERGVRCKGATKVVSTAAPYLSGAQREQLPGRKIYEHVNYRCAGTVNSMDMDSGEFFFIRSQSARSG
jgi:pyruvate carboxylase